MIGLPDLFGSLHAGDPGHIDVEKDKIVGAGGKAA